MITIQGGTRKIRGYLEGMGPQGEITIGPCGRHTRRVQVPEARSSSWVFYLLSSGGQGKTAFASLKSSGRCKAWFDSRPGGQPRKGNIKQKGSEFSPSLLPFTWFGNTLSCMLFRATRLAGKAGQQPAAWPEDLGPYMPNLRKALTIRGCQVAPDVRQCVENLWRIFLA